MPRLILLITGMLSCVIAFSQISINGSYLNVSRPSGGPLVPGDILELHAVISVNSGTSITGLYYTDNIPAGTSYIPGSLKVTTNENKVIAAIANTGNYTDAADADQGQVVGSAITVYMGTGATSSAGGSITGGTTKPAFGTNNTILMVGYQVRVTATVGSTITTAGTFYYNKSGAQTVNVSPTTLAVTQPYTCGSTATTNYVAQEANGTFSSGNVQNRTIASSNVTGYTYIKLAANNPADGQYSIIDNTSPTTYSGSSPASSDKVFSVWDVIGDHTGATNTATGNSPTAKNATGGYMLAVNATYTPAIVFTTTMSGLYNGSVYTVSFWVRNICSKCGNDPQTGSSTGLPGVNPNLSINLNGVNYYSTGDITYTGTWVQKSFTFLNSGTNVATLDVRNNAPGGGGNDWVLDDISMSYCLIVLPVKLESFTGQTTPQGNLLKWRVDQAPDLHHFEVERSTDGSIFSSIGEVAGLADVDGYQFTDESLPSSASILYYRLRMVTKDGNATYSNIVVLYTGSTEGLVTRLAPNPAHASTTLLIGSSSGGTAQITLLNMAGIPLYKQSATIAAGTTRLNLALPAHLPPGIYIVRTNTVNASTTSRLIIH